MIERFPVSPETCTVRGYRVNATQPTWTRLDFNRAGVRQKATIMVAALGYADAPDDLHLRVYWCHPDGPCWDRVRPIAKVGRKWRGRMVEHVALEPAPGDSPPWQIVVTFASPP